MRSIRSPLSLLVLSVAVLAPRVAAADFGFEVELRREVNDEQRKEIGGEQDLGVYKEGSRVLFKVVTDHRKDDNNRSYSNLEMVSRPFDQINDGGKFDEIYKAMMAFRDCLYADDNEKTLAQVAVSCPKFKPKWRDAILTPTGKARPGDKKNVVYVQYTVGVPVDRIEELITQLVVSANKGSSDAAKYSSEQGLEALQLAEMVKDKHARGFVALLYMQISAVAKAMGELKTDGAVDGIVKNDLLGLSRANLRDVFESLPENAQKELEVNQKDLTTAIFQSLNKATTKLGTIDANTEIVSRFYSGTLTFGLYIDSAFDGDTLITQKHAFEDMTLVKPHTQSRADSYSVVVVPIELRHYKKKITDWDTFAKYCKEIQAAATAWVGEALPVSKKKPREAEETPIGENMLDTDEGRADSKKSKMKDEE